MLSSSKRARTGDDELLSVEMVTESGPTSSTPQDHNHMCSICMETMTFPTLWSCNKHIACYSCVLRQKEFFYVLQFRREPNWAGDFDSHIPKLELTTTRNGKSLKCPECNHKGAQHTLLPMSVINLYQPKSEANTPWPCPYCKLSGASTEHVSKCHANTVRCPVQTCRGEIPVHNPAAHFLSECTAYTCHKSSCTAYKTPVSLLDAVLHRQQHAVLEQRQQVKELLQQIEQYVQSVGDKVEAGAVCRKIQASVDLLSDEEMCPVRGSIKQLIKRLDAAKLCTDLVEKLGKRVNIQNNKQQQSNYCDYEKNAWMRLRIHELGRFYITQGDAAPEYQSEESDFDD